MTPRRGPQDAQRHDAEGRRKAAGVPHGRNLETALPGRDGERENGSDGECEFCADLPHSVATHCVRCHASWTRASKTAHCMTCHRTFTTPRVFDGHLKQIGCVDPADVTTRDGEPRYAEPTPNKWGTPVYRLAGTNPWSET